MLRAKGLDPLDLSCKQICCQADYTIFRNFKNFESKFNIWGEPALRELCLKTDNIDEGRIFSDLLKVNEIFWKENQLDISNVYYFKIQIFSEAI